MAGFRQTRHGLNIEVRLRKSAARVLRELERNDRRHGAAGGNSASVLDRIEEQGS